MKKLLLYIILIVLILAPSAGMAGDNPMKGPQTLKKVKAAKHQDTVGEGFMITAYQQILSPVGGARCGMHPSCSHYGRECFEEFGLLKGYIMTCDRLMRCGRDEVSLAPQIWVNGKKKCWDPVSENVWDNNRE